jgi:regulator of protease activity HflC (stomatin/prohibitin superfamily)
MSADLYVLLYVKFLILSIIWMLSAGTFVATTGVEPNFWPVVLVFGPVILSLIPAILFLLYFLFFEWGTD